VAEEHTPNRFRISWDGGAYYVSIPNYRGGWVVPAACADDLVKALEAIKQATIDGRVCDDVAWFDNITTLHDFCDEVLGRVKGRSTPDA
jgi:hypothetical protein